MRQNTAIVFNSLFNSTTQHTAYLLLTCCLLAAHLPLSGATLDVVTDFDFDFKIMPLFIPSRTRSGLTNSPKSFMNIAFS
jgi:hypothetical protein